ncbi:hypothetical protein VNO80_12345 [Phaseolus coccineus]|uniref:Uncharacterized protein n=1 Tax=Phaseolus coccineus TaxID=3886 RepID=A0AAN9REW9_PHACN
MSSRHTLKKKSGHQLPYELTLAHYHATGSGINDYRKIKSDFGLSIVAKIRSIGGNLTIMVDGPEQHPSSALLYMFDEVSRNGYWYREMCPHCAKNPKKQNGALWQSESEVTDNTPRGPSLGGSGKKSRVISNGGMFAGDGNSNFYERNIFNLIYQHEWTDSNKLGGRNELHHQIVRLHLHRNYPKKSIQVVELHLQIDLEMGNSPSGPRLLGNGPRLMGNGKNCSYHIKLDNEATITVTKDHKKSQKWELEYVVDGMSSGLSISRSTGRSSGDENIWICVSDLYRDIQQNPIDIRPQFALLYVVAEKEKKNDGFVCGQFEAEVCDTLFREAKEKQYGESRKGEVETSYWAYGCGARMGLLVTETKKKKSNEEQVYMATVAHYYVNSGRNFGRSGVDIGFSVVVKIGVISGQLDFSVDGPVEHPSSALRYMIEEVIRTGTWKLSACPHCKNIQSQRKWLSESEDSDTPLLPPPPPPRYGGSQNAANMGRFNGDCNGSIIQANKINFNKW